MPVVVVAGLILLRVLVVLEVLAEVAQVVLVRQVQTELLILVAVQEVGGMGLVAHQVALAL